jgi:hypothetical protein
VSLVRSAPSKPLLLDLAAQGVPTVVIHGDRDLAVPYRTARDAARDAHAWLVTVHGGTHSWVLKDPGTLPGIAAALLQGPLGELRDQVVTDAGLDPATATTEEIEELFLEPDAEVRRLTPPWAPPAIPGPVDPARYRWTIEPPGGVKAGAKGPEAT